MDQRNPIVRRSVLRSQLGRFDGHPLVCGFFKSGRVCMAGARCPFAHKIPRRFGIRTGLDNPRFVEWLASNVYMGAVDPPIDQTIKTLYLCRLNSNVNDQHIRERFSPYGEIESVVYFALRGTDGAFLTYTTRQAAEKAMLEHSSWVLINGENVKLLWGAHVIPKEAVVQKNLTPVPKNSKPLKVYTRKRKRSNNGGGFNLIGVSRATMVGRGQPFPKKVMAFLNSWENRVEKLIMHGEANPTKERRHQVARHGEPEPKKSGW